MLLTMYFNLVLLLLLHLVCEAHPDEIPSFVHLCKRNLPNMGDCLVNTLEEIIPQLVKGIPEMDIPPIDPLKFSSIKINTGNRKSVSMDIELLEGTASGMHLFKIENIKMNFDKMEFSASIFVPFVKVEAVYKVNGKILMFELHGTGHATFNASDIQCDGLWLGSTYVKNNNTHLNIDKITFYNVKLKNLQVKLENLFEDNQALTDNVNNAINEDIETLREELQPLVVETVADIFRDYFNRVYRRFPMDQLYPLD